MVQYSNFDRVMEARDDFKNEANPKCRIMLVVIVALFLFACKSTQKSVDVDTDTDVIYFSNVDEYPRFKGRSAEEGFLDYVARNTIYPPYAKKNGITGRVFVEFIVEKNGSVRHTKVVGGANQALEAEALRVVKSSPKWTPGKINSEPVRMRYTIPFNFRILNVSNTSSLKEVELSEETILLQELVVVGYQQ